MKAVEDVVHPAQSDGEAAIVSVQELARTLQHGLDHVGHAERLARGVCQRHGRGRDRTQVQIARRGRVIRQRPVGQHALKRARHRGQEKEEQNGQRHVEEQVEGNRLPAGIELPTADHGCELGQEGQCQGAADKPIDQVADRQPKRRRTSRERADQRIEGATQIGAQDHCQGGHSVHQASIGQCGDDQDSGNARVHRPGEDAHSQRGPGAARA